MQWSWIMHEPMVSRAMIMRSFLGPPCMSHLQCRMLRMFPPSTDGTLPTVDAVTLLNETIANLTVTLCIVNHSSPITIDHGSQCRIRSSSSFERGADFGRGRRHHGPNWPLRCHGKKSNARKSIRECLKPRIIIDTDRLV